MNASHRKTATKILFIIPSLKPGGAEYQTIQQVNHLHRSNYKISLLILAKTKTNLLHDLDLPPDKIYFLNLTDDTLNFKTAFSISSLWQAITVFRKAEVELIIANLPLGHLYGRIIKLFNPSVKLITYHRSLQFEANPIDTFRKRLFFRLQKILAKKLDDTSICISKAVRVNIENNFVLKNPVIIYNSVVDKYEHFGECLPLENRILNIIVPGRLHPSKGHAFLIDCLEELYHKQQIKPESCQITFAGGGRIEEDLKKIIDNKGLSGLIKITGALPNKQLLELICKASFVIIPSIHEGLGNVAIESLMLGKTILCSDAGGLKEIIVNEVNGYTFPKLNKNTFEILFTNMINNYPDSLIDHMTCRDSYLTRFSYQVHVNNLEKTINETISSQAL